MANRYVGASVSFSRAAAKTSTPIRITNGWDYQAHMAHGRVEHELRAFDEDQGFQTAYFRFDSKAEAYAYAETHEAPTTKA